MKTRYGLGALSLFRSYFLVAVTMGLIVCPVGAQPGEALARQIVADSGFQGGLIVLVGGWDADLALSLGKAPNGLVHWLMRDGKGLEEARREIRDAGVYGQVSAMAWEEPKLPYADGMVNLLALQHDEGLKIDRSEVARVLAPMGVEVQFRGGVNVRALRFQPSGSPF